MKSKVVFVEARCQTSGELFYIRYDQTVADMWIKSKALKPEEMQSEETDAASGGSMNEVDLSKCYTGRSQLALIAAQQSG